MSQICKRWAILYLHRLHFEKGDLDPVSVQNQRSFPFLVKARWRPVSCCAFLSRDWDFISGNLTNPLRSLKLSGRAQIIYCLANPILLRVVRLLLLPKLSTARRRWDSACLYGATSQST
jgi:hypothetical protein